MKYCLHILPLFLLPLLQNCDTDRLGDCPCTCTPPEGARIQFDWHNDPSASPAGMRVWLYPIDWQADPIPLDFPGTDGGQVNVTPGRYRIISYNNDTEWSLPSGESDFSSHTISTRDADLFEPLRDTGATRSESGSSSERTAATPDPVWSAVSKEELIGNGSVTTLAPVPLHCHYTYVFKNVGPLGHVVAASASISGMVTSVGLSDLSRSGDVCTHPLHAVVDEDQDVIKGDFYTFGVTGSADVANRMALYVVMDSGKAYKFTEGDNLDVTKQIASAPDPRNVNLVITGIHMPDEATGDSKGAFEISVDGWADEHRNVPV